MIKAVKAIGGNTDFLTAQAFTFSRDETCLAAIISATGEDVFTKVRVAGVKLEDDFFEVEGKTVDNLQLVFDQVLSNLAKQTDSLSLILALWQKNVLYLLSKGDHQAFLSRANQLINLISPGADQQLISGYLEPHDRLVLISQRKEGEEFVHKLLTVAPEDLEDEIELSLSQSDKLEPIATIIVEEVTEEVVGERVLKTRDLKTIGARAQNLLRGLFQNRQARLIFVGAVMVSLAALIGYLFINQSQSQTNQRFLGSLTAAREKYAQAQNLKDSDPQAAKQAWDEAQQHVNQALNLKPNDGGAKNLKEEIDQSKNTILKVIELSTLSPFLSLDLIKKDFSAKKMSYSLGKVLLLDENQKTLVAVDLNKKTNQILAGSTQLGRAQLASLNGDLAFVYSEDRGVLRVDLQTQKTTTIVKPDPEWGKISGLYAFSSNVYLMDSLKNQIWKYVPVKSGYSDKTAYLKSNQKVDLAGGSNLQIDYSVWVLKSGPEILKFTGGVTDNFSVGGLDKPISSISIFFVPEKDDIVYLIDPQNSRLVVLSKNGQYLAQYLNEKFNSASDLIVAEKKLYLLEGNTIYTAELK